MKKQKTHCMEKSVFILFMNSDQRGVSQGCPRKKTIGGWRGEFFQPISKLARPLQNIVVN